MMDYRITTFLTLCQEMNYRKTAQLLQMTQPAVTQHIQYLERSYGVPLFDYTNKRLTCTPQGQSLEAFLRSAYYNEQAFRTHLLSPSAHPISVGCTKTIGEYVIAPKVVALLSDAQWQVSVSIDNTQHLLERLNRMELDLLLLEGYFDKEYYGFQPLQQEELVGICSKDHPFAGQSVPLPDLFSQHLLLRESGSGTRATLERALATQDYSVNHFTRQSVLSGFPLILAGVQAGCGISFVYQSVLAGNPQLATFHIQDLPMFHLFHLVYLKNTSAQDFVPLFL